jgi:hypothetical protein
MSFARLPLAHVRTPLDPFLFLEPVPFELIENAIGRASLASSGANRSR